MTEEERRAARGPRKSRARVWTPEELAAKEVARAEAAVRAAARKRAASKAAAAARASELPATLGTRRRLLG